MEITAIVGLGRNCGKTALLNYLASLYRTQGSLALMNIGCGRMQAKTGSQPGQGVWPHVEPSDIIVTTLPLAKAAGLNTEILELAEGREAFGRLIIGRVQRRGSVCLMGSEHLSSLKKAAQLIAEHNWAQNLLVDGATNRLTQVYALGSVNFALSFVCDRVNLRSCAEKLRMFDQLAKLPLNSSTTEHFWPGPFTAASLEELPKDTETLILEDFSKVFLTPAEFARLTRRVQLSLRQPVKLKLLSCICKDITFSDLLEELGSDFALPLCDNPYRPELDITLGKS